LGERGGGECERVQQRAFFEKHHRERERVGLLQGGINKGPRIGICFFPLPPNTKDKEEEGMLQ
jgi:hypothetical protein